MWFAQHRNGGASCMFNSLAYNCDFQDAIGNIAPPSKLNQINLSLKAQLTRRPTGAPVLRVNEALARRSLRTPKGTRPTQGIPQKENDSPVTALPEMPLATLQLREDNGVNL